MTRPHTYSSLHSSTVRAHGSKEVKLTIMPTYCAVYGCFSNYRNKDGITFHRFPKNEDVKKKWISVCKKQDPVNANRAVICSLHFDASAYQRNLKYELLDQPVPKHLVRIKEGSIPTQQLPTTQGGADQVDPHSPHGVEQHPPFSEAVVLDTGRSYSEQGDIAVEEGGEVDSIDPLSTEEPPSPPWTLGSISVKEECEYLEVKAEPFSADEDRTDATVTRNEPSLAAESLNGKNHSTGLDCDDERSQAATTSDSHPNFCQTRISETVGADSDENRNKCLTNPEPSKKRKLGNSENLQQDILVPNLEILSEVRDFKAMVSVHHRKMEAMVSDHHRKMEAMVSAHHRKMEQCMESIAVSLEALANKK